MQNSTNHHKRAKYLYIKSAILMFPIYFGLNFIIYALMDRTLLSFFSLETKSMTYIVIFSAFMAFNFSLIFFQNPWFKLKRLKNYEQAEGNPFGNIIYYVAPANWAVKKKPSIFNFYAQLPGDLLVTPNGLYFDTSTNSGATIPSKTIFFEMPTSISVKRKWIFFLTLNIVDTEGEHHFFLCQEANIVK